MNRFEELLKVMPPSTGRDALMEVADTAFMCRAWLEIYSKSYTARDLLDMTNLVLQREVRNSTDQRETMPVRIGSE